MLEAYRRALALEPDYVLQVDGDGQFHGRDLRRVLVLLQDQAGAVCGVRRFRQDPWFRMVMTRLLRLYVRVAYGVRVRDPNCPLRGYEASVLADQLAAVPAASLVPNLYLTVVAAQRGVALVEVDVSHRNRRGSSAAGTSWGRGRSPIPWRLVRFSRPGPARVAARPRAAARRAAARVSGTCAVCGAAALEPHLRVAGRPGPEGLVPTTDRYGTALADIARCRALRPHAARPDARRRGARRAPSAMRTRRTCSPRRRGSARAPARSSPGSRRACAASAAGRPGCSTSAAGSACCSTRRAPAAGR